MATPPPPPSSSAPREQFETTHWTVVLSAVNAENSKGADALARLCSAYWHPLYAFARRAGQTAHDAEDMTQAFFEHLLHGDMLKRVDQSKGRFRSFLLASFTYFLANELRNSRRQKRGGGVSLVSLDAAAAEDHFLDLASKEFSPEQLYDRSWAETLLDIVMIELREEYAAAGKSPLFQTLSVFLTTGNSTTTYEEVAARLETTADAVRKSVSRLRQRYGERLRAKIASTVNSETEVEEELQALRRALGGA